MALKLDDQTPELCTPPEMTAKSELTPLMHPAVFPQVTGYGLKVGCVTFVLQPVPVLTTTASVMFGTAKKPVKKMPTSRKRKLVLKLNVVVKFLFILKTFLSEIISNLRLS